MYDKSLSVSVTAHFTIGFESLKIDGSASVELSERISEDAEAEWAELPELFSAL